MLGFLRKRQVMPDSTLTQGLRALEEFDYDRAIPLLADAHAQSPDDIEAAQAYGRALIQDARLDQARDLFAALLERFPGHESGHIGMALLLLESWDLDAATRRLDQALAINPASSEAWLARARILKLQSCVEEAIAAVDQALQQDPESAAAYLERAHIALEKRDIANAYADYSIALELSPDNPDAFVLSSMLENLAGNVDKSLEMVEQALLIHPRNVTALSLKCRYLFKLGSTEEALELLQQSLELSPKKESTHFYLGECYARVNNMEKARESFNKVIELNPGNGLAHYNIAKITTYTHKNSHVAAMEHQLETLPQQAWLPRMQLSFSLSKACEDLGEYDAAFAYMKQGNALMWEHAIQYDYQQVATQHAGIKETYTAELLARFAETGPESTCPIFILGMPRSGSTLIDHILDSHPHITSIGESNLWQVVVQENLQHSGRMDNDSSLIGYLAQTAGPDYIRQLQERRGDASHVINKALHNYMEIGLISCCLPGAHIIHSRRMPLDTCISCYKNLLDINQPYIYNLEELGRYYLLYQDMMDHWDAVLPGKVIHVDYEKLVADPETEIRSLLERLGIDFHPACLEFYKNKRMVHTASLAQVRQPMYTSSVASWRRYERQLQPLVQLLGKSGLMGADSGASPS